MKLLIVLSIIAYGYADKLDRAYLPPVNAATAGGSPGALIAPGVTAASRQPNSNFAQEGPAGFVGGVPSGRQPGLESGQRYQSNLGVVSGNAQNGPGFGAGNQQGPSGTAINSFTSTGSNGNLPLLGANAPIGQGQKFGSSLTQGANTFNVGSQQTYRPQSENPARQGLGQETQSYNEAQGYKSERPQAAADRNAEILKYVNENNGESYLYSYETSNGISVEESGDATNGVRAQGGFSYTGDDGQSYSLTYTADENGFQPQGEHLPTPHPIPEEILKSIEENSRAAAAGTQEGAYRPEEYESEGSPQQYNVGASFKRPQDSYQGSSSQGPASQAQNNQYSVNTPSFSPNSNTAQLNQFDRSRPGQSVNQFGAGSNGPQEQIKQYQQGSDSNQGLVDQFPGQSGQIGNVTPIPGLQKQSNQYQKGFGGNQRPFSPSTSQGSINQGLGQDSQGQGSSGYNYNKPQSTVSTVQTRPQPSQGQIITTSGSSNGKGNFGIQSGRLSPSEKPFGTSSQFGQSQNSLNRPGNQPKGSTAILGQGQQNLFNANKPSFGSTQGSQVRPESQGYQYETNANRPSFGINNNNNPSASSFQPDQGSKYQPDAYKPSIGANNGIKGSTQLGGGQGQQYQKNRPFGGISGSNQESSPVGGSSGSKKPGSVSLSGKPNQPFGSNLGPSASQFGLGSQQSTSPQGPSSPKGSAPVQAPYEYNKPSQSIPTQQQSSGNQGLNGNRPSASSFGSQGYNVQRPGASSTRPQGINGPSFNSQGSQDVTGQQRVGGQGADGGFSGPQDQRTGASFPGSQTVFGQRPTYEGAQGVNTLPEGNSSGQRQYAQEPSGPSQGNLGRSEQFGGPRQPPSFNPQEGYKY